MARLQRRGIGIYYRDRAGMENELLRSRIDALELAYDRLWADAEKCIGDYKNSWFWDLMLRTTGELMAPLVRELPKMMHRCTASAIMYWNAGQISADDIGARAYRDFERWFYQDFIPEHEKHCEAMDKKLLERLNSYIAESMERDGVKPVRLPYLSTSDYYTALRQQMVDELLPTVEMKLRGMVPSEIKDTRFPALRRRRLRRGLDSFFENEREHGREYCDFVTDVLIGEKLELDHANSVLHALGRSIVAEALYILR